MRILIGADVVATKRNQELFNNGDVKELVGNELLTHLEASDVRVFNIEAPLTNMWTPTKKAGSPKANLWMSEKSINGIKSLNPSFVTLANNHIMDQGEKGLVRTREILNKANIRYGGIGDNIDEASKCQYLDVDGKKLGIYCCAEHEFSIAGQDCPGANPFDPLESLDHIHEARKRCDYLIVLYHGGREFYRYPSPGLQHRFRRMADKGADLVVAQHTHCVGCREEYNNSTLVYGQGNFIFDYGDDEYWNNGLLIEVDCNVVSYIPYFKENGKIRMDNGGKGKIILDDFRHRSEKIANQKFVEDEFLKYANEKLGDLLSVIHGRSLWFRMMNKMHKFMGDEKYALKIYSNKDLLSTLNYLECEAHHESLIWGLKSQVI